VKFLEFVTASPIITYNSYQEIVVELVELEEDEEADVLIPTSSTCARTLFIQYTKLDDDEDSYTEFKNRMNKALDLGLHFGLQ
jgi:hypothetical protein